MKSSLFSIFLAKWTNFITKEAILSYQYSLESIFSSIEIYAKFGLSLTANNSGGAFLCEKKRTFYSRGVFQISIYTVSTRRIVARSFNMEEVQRLSPRFG